jgi:hypothetical protein
MEAALGVVIVCVALATTMEVIITTAVAKRMINGRDDFCIRFIRVFIGVGSFPVGFLRVDLPQGFYQNRVGLATQIGFSKPRSRIEVHRLRRAALSPIQVPQTPSAFHLREQQNAFRRRDVTML